MFQLLHALGATKNTTSKYSLTAIVDYSSENFHIRDPTSFEQPMGFTLVFVTTGYLIAKIHLRC